MIQKALSADHEVTMAETSRRGHATRLAQGAAVEGIDVVVVLGGDGTLNEAANGLAGSDTALAALPGGSTNVFARTLGLPDDAIEATVVVLDALAQNSIRRVGLGMVNGRYFLFHAGMGFDAAVIARVERRASLKRYASHPLFLFSAFETWFRGYDHERPHFAVHFPDGDVIDDAYFGVCLNTNPYTYLGARPVNVAPGTNLDTGLAMVSMRSLALPTIVSIGLSTLGSGQRLRKHPAVDHRSDLSSVRIEGFGPFPYQVDGDYLGEVSALEFQHKKDILALVIP